MHKDYNVKTKLNIYEICLKKLIWRSQSLSNLTPIIFNMELTHLVFEVSIKLNRKRWVYQKWEID